MLFVSFVVKAAESEKGTGNFFQKKVASSLRVLFSTLRTLRSLRLNLRFRIFFYVAFVFLVVKAILSSSVAALPRWVLCG